jgi:hypothetical protein
MSVGLDRLSHLAGRFVGSLRAKPLAAGDVTRVRALLTPEEFVVWERLGRADRAESIAVARRAVRGTGSVNGPWIAAALLHDVGKVEAALGTLGRSLAALVGGVVGHDRARRWQERTGWQGRVGRYIAHDEVGAALLSAAGARAEAAYWAEVHHRPERWDGRTIPDEICFVLAQADGDRIRD